MANRGRERQIICAGCGRQTRRDKAVFIEMVVFQNPVERKDVVDQEAYKQRLTREVGYCPSCGKHRRIYEKKKKMLEAQKERAENRPIRAKPINEANSNTKPHSRTGGYKEPTTQKPANQFQQEQDAA